MEVISSMRPKSNTLFHFTKSPDTLKSVLREGFWPRYCLEDIGWLGFEKNAYIAYPMVCFCEIPLARIAEHVSYYGEFGLGLTREWAETQGLNPVFYTSKTSGIPAVFRETAGFANDLPTQAKKDASFNATRHLLAHAKPTSGKTLLKGVAKEKVFYQESEWRYVPRNSEFPDFLHQSKFENSDELDASNLLTKEHGMLNFSPRDVRYIFVKQDSDVPSMVDFISTQLKHHIAAELQMLMSRVVSLESLRYDL